MMWSPVDPLRFHSFTFVSPHGSTERESSEVGEETVMYEAIQRAEVPHSQRVTFMTVSSPHDAHFVSHHEHECNE